MDKGSKDFSVRKRVKNADLFHHVGLNAGNTYCSLFKEKKLRKVDDKVDDLNDTSTHIFILNLNETTNTLPEQDLKSSSSLYPV